MFFEYSLCSICTTLKIIRYEITHKRLPVFTRSCSRKGQKDHPHNLNAPTTVWAANAVVRQKKMKSNLKLNC